MDGVGGSGRQVRRRAAALRHSLLGQDKSLLDDFADDDDDDVDYDNNAPMPVFTATRGRGRRGRPPKSVRLFVPSSKSAGQPFKAAIQPGSSLRLVL